MVVTAVAARRQRGAAYLTLMISVAVISAILATTAEIVSHAQQRAREQHLLWVGDQIRRALVSYARFPAGIDTYPKELEDLVNDRRRPLVQNHLRRLYFDPMTGSTDWGVVRNPQQRIVGVFSKSTLTPIKTAGFPTHYNEFEKATSYADWQFVVAAAAQPAAPVAPTPAGQGKPAPILQPLPGSSFAPAPIGR
ncbi:MAG TPA: type II secretion system protein [Rhodocyclaceae bacterium]